MLNEKKERELAYVVYIDDLKPIEGKDRVECAVVNGWTVMVRKGDFSVGDPAVYIEIDSLCPQKEEFAFLELKKYKVKTQKYGNFYSQGLLMPAKDFGWEIDSAQFSGGAYYIKDELGMQHFPDTESAFLTKKLGIKYYDPEDEKRKKSYDPEAKYKKMASKHPKVFQNPIIKKIYKTNIGKKVLYLFFGKGCKVKNWPEWVKKTDEERVENMSWILESNEPWICTEKIDGSSTTITMKRELFKNKFYVCSRNVVFDKPDKQCYYSENIYQEMAEKYKLEDVCTALLKDHPDAEWVTIQGETFGAGVQKRDYGRNDRDFRAFNLIFSNTGRLNTVAMKAELDKYNVPCVPILAVDYKLPKTIEELRAYVHSQSSVEDGGMREGIVFRSQDGTRSFKCVDPEYIIKYH